MNSDTALLYLKPYPWDPHRLKLLAWNGHFSNGSVPHWEASWKGLLLQNSRSQHACVGEIFLQLSKSIHIFSVDAWALLRNGIIKVRMELSPMDSIMKQHYLFSPGALQVTWTFCQILTTGFAYLLASISACKVFKVVANPNNCIWQPKRQQWAQCCLWSGSSKGQNSVYVGSVDLFNNWHPQRRGGNRRNNNHKTQPRHHCLGGVKSPGAGRWMMMAMFTLPVCVHMLPFISPTVYCCASFPTHAKRFWWMALPGAPYLWLSLCLC